MLLFWVAVAVADFVTGSVALDAVLAEAGDGWFVAGGAVGGMVADSVLVDMAAMSVLLVTASPVLDCPLGVERITRARLSSLPAIEPAWAFAFSAIAASALSATLGIPWIESAAGYWLR